MSKLNLSEAAAEILTASKNGAGSESFGAGKKSSVSTPGQKEVNLGTAGHKTTDPNYDAAKGLSQATLPTGKGVAAEVMKKLSGQPQQTQGRKDLATSPEGTETPEDTKVNRGKGPTPKQTMSKNAGAQCVSVPEGEEEDEWEEDPDQEEYEDELEEATIEEVEADLKKLSDEAFEKKYGVSKQADQKQISGAEEKAEKSSQQKEKMKEDIDAMLSGEDLSEEFKEKATVIFEAAVTSRVEAIAEEMEQQFIQQFEEAVAVVAEDFGEKLDSYLDYIVENWMEDNKVAVEKGLRSEIVEDFIGALKNVFEEHYIDIPEEKVDVVEELVTKVEELEDSINEHIEKNIQLKKRLFEHAKQESIHAVCEGLTLSQAEKIKSLANTIEFVSEEDFTEKLNMIKESYYAPTVTPSNTLNEPVELDEDYSTKVVDPLIEQYVNKIARMSKF